MCTHALTRLPHCSQGIEATPEDVELLTAEMGVGPEGTIAFATFAAHMARLRA